MISTKDYKVRLGVSEFETRKSNVLQGYVDANYAGNLDQRRSIMSYVFTIAECVVNWKAELQDTMAFSTRQNT